MGEQVKVSAPLSSEKVDRDGELEQRYFELLQLRHRVRIAECGRVIRADPDTGEEPVRL
jgi:hypothetical protein